LKIGGQARHNAVKPRFIKQPSAVIQLRLQDVIISSPFINNLCCTLPLPNTRQSASFEWFELRLGPKQQSPQVMNHHTRITSLQQCVNSRFQLKIIAGGLKMNKAASTQVAKCTIATLRLIPLPSSTPLQEIIEFLHPCDEPRRDFSELTLSRNKKRDNDDSSLQTTKLKNGGGSASIGD